MPCIITETQSNQLTRYDETKKMAYDSQIVRAKENPKLSMLRFNSKAFKLYFFFQEDGSLYIDDLT